METTELPVDPTGKYLITTEASVYLLDFEVMEMTRFPGAVVVPLPTAWVSRLRGDHEPVSLLMVIHCKVGDSMFLLVQGLAETGPTLRGSTPVQKIEALTS